MMRTAKVRMCVPLCRLLERKTGWLGGVDHVATGELEIPLGQQQRFTVPEILQQFEESVRCSKEKSIAVSSKKSERRCPREEEYREHRGEVQGDTSAKCCGQVSSSQSQFQGECHKTDQVPARASPNLIQKRRHELQVSKTMQ